MSTVNTPRTTAYKEYVFSNLPARVATGQGLYNYVELAALVGLKPTGNFRRRVKELVAQGRLDAVAVFTPRGGIEARFMANPQQAEGEIPF